MRARGFALQRANLRSVARACVGDEARLVRATNALHERLSSPPCNAASTITHAANAANPIHLLRAIIVPMLDGAGVMAVGPGTRRRDRKTAQASRVGLLRLCQHPGNPYGS